MENAFPAGQWLSEKINVSMVNGWYIPQRAPYNVP